MPVRVTGLSFRYAASPRWVLRDVDLTAHAGETLLLLGPSGCGKSTLALCLNGLIPAAIAGEMLGEVWVGEHSTRAASAAQLCQMVGEVFQDPETQLIMPRADEEVAFGLENLAVPAHEMPERIAEALAEVGMLGQRRAWVDALSGGQKQRLALAAVLALRPSVLVLDEPTANLDPAATTAFFETLRRLRTTVGPTIVLIEHRLDTALPLADRVVALDQAGTVMAAGTPQAVFSGHAEALAQQGVWLPAACRLARALAAAGRPLPACPISLAEATSVLGPLLAATPDPPEIPPAEPLPAGAENAIEVEEVEFAHAGGPPILRQVNFHLRRGAFCALVGGNGAGKTTLARQLIGLLRPTRGRIRVLGRDVQRLSISELGKQVGYVFQNPEHQFVSERVADELAFSLRGRWGMAETRRRAEQLLHVFGLEDYADANPFALSQGQKRRLSVATMVALEQPILILDEPTFGQDQRTAAALMELLRDLHARGTTILLITHDMELVAEHAQEVAVIWDGWILYHGPTRDLFRRPNLLQQAALGMPPLARLGQWVGHPELVTLRDWIRRLQAGFNYAGG